MKRLHLALGSIALACCLFFGTSGSGIAALQAQEHYEICQLMQMERGDAFRLESTEVPPKIEKTKTATASGVPVLDATPVISWVDPAAKLKAVLVCVHGLGLHKENYEQFGKRMAPAGYGVYSMDVRGFGEFQTMPGERKCDFKKCLDDVCEGLKVARSIHPGIPVFVLGESMGGAIAMRVTEEHPELMDGLISSVPGAKRYGQTKSALQVGLKLLTHGTHAQVNVGKSVVEQSTNKEELRKEWSQDELARFTLTPIELMQFQHFMDANEKNADKINRTPVLMVQGNDDKLVKQEDNKNILDRIAVDDKELVYVLGGEHLIFEEGQFKDDAIAVLCAWIDEHCKMK